MTTDLTLGELDDYEMQFSAIERYGDSITMTLGEARKLIAAARQGIRLDKLMTEAALQVSLMPSAPAGAMEPCGVSDGISGSAGPEDHREVRYAMGSGAVYQGIDLSISKRLLELAEHSAKADSLKERLAQFQHDCPIYAEALARIEALDQELTEERDRRRRWESSAIYTGKEIVKREAENKRLREALKDCADELASEVTDRYKDTLQYPTQQRRYDRDMASVVAARAALSGGTNE